MRQQSYQSAAHDLGIEVRIFSMQGEEGQGGCGKWKGHVARKADKQRVFTQDVQTGGLRGSRGRLEYSHATKCRG